MTLSQCSAWDSIANLVFSSILSACRAFIQEITGNGIYNKYFLRFNAQKRRYTV